MRKTLVVLLALLLTATASQAAEDKKAEKDEDKIVGAWVMVSGERGGEKAPDKLVKSFRLTYAAGGKVTVRSKQDKEEEGTFKLDASKKPAQIDLKVGDKSLEGIYTLEGDNLKLCLAEAGERPTEFKSADGSKTMLMILRREKK